MTAAIMAANAVAGALDQRVGARIVVAGVCMEPDRIEPFFGIVKELALQFVLGYTPEEFARKRDVLHQHCEDLGRDPKEIRLSSHVIFTGDPKATAEQAAALACVGADLGIIYLRPPLDPGVLEPLATALAQH